MATTRNMKRQKVNAIDHLSSLPDDILLNILSRLAIKGQVRIGILSTRWKNLWIFNTTGFSICPLDIFSLSELIQLLTRFSHAKTLKFIDRTDQILRMHRGQTLDELQITYPMAGSETLSDNLKVDGWINISKQKQVKALHFDFKSFKNSPVLLLSIGSTTFSSLVSLRLKFASLSAHIIHCVLSNCLNLLKLSIIRTNGDLQHLKISGSSLKLKHLELIHNDMDFLEIFAPNLVSFGFGTRGMKRQPRICFKNIRLLTQLSLYQVLTLDTWSDYDVLLSQLDTLTLLDYSVVDAIIPHFPILKNLKELNVINKGAHLCLFFGLLKAPPSLCRLSLDLGLFENPPLKHEFTKQCTDHRFVQEVEISNFNASDNEVQLVTYVAQSCSSLKKMIIHPSICKWDSGGKAIPINKERIESVVKSLALRLPQKEWDILFVPTNGPNIFNI